MVNELITMRVGAAVAALSMVATLAACGSPGPSSSVTTTSTTSPSTTSAADESLAQSELLQIGDFPTGWTSSGSVSAGNGNSSLTPHQDQQIASCLGMPASSVNINSAEASSPSFSDSSGVLTVSNDVSVFANSQVARTDFSTFSNSRSPSCLLSVLGMMFRQEIQSQLSQGQSLGALSASIRQFPAYGDESGEMEIVAPVNASGVSVKVYLDLILVVKGRSESLILTISPASPIPAANADQLASNSAAHLS
jgi:hypothetical protein